MRLFEHDDFEQALIRAAEHFGVSEQFVEKDYYVTEVLRIVVGELGDAAMFKGGTSLSKGWGLITRFSEDIDLFVNTAGCDPPPGNSQVNRILKDLATAVGEHPALSWQRDEGRTIGGLAREDYFAYETRFAELPGVRPVVRLEPGIQSGTFPTEIVPIASLVAQFLSEQAVVDLADDIEGFQMTLLHYRRTFVEKLFALHGKVVRLIDEGVPLGRDSRHYSDLYVLAGEHEVRAMLATGEYTTIREDYDRNSRKFFARSYRPPAELSFRDSPALFPEPALLEQLAADYDQQCRLLFSGEYPPFEHVLERFAEIRSLL